MRIECPECGARYTFDKPIPLDKKYSCKKCTAVVTFRQIADTQETIAQVPPEKAQPAIQPEVKKEPVSQGKVQPAKQEKARKEPVLETSKRFSTRYLVIVGILVIVVIVVIFFMYR